MGRAERSSIFSFPIGVEIPLCSRHHPITSLLFIADFHMSLSNNSIHPPKVALSRLLGHSALVTYRFHVWCALSACASLHRSIISGRNWTLLASLMTLMRILVLF